MRVPRNSMGRALASVLGTEIVPTWTAIETLLIHHATLSNAPANTLALIRRRPAWDLQQSRAMENETLQISAGRS